MKAKPILSRLCWAWRSTNKIQLMVLSVLVAVGLALSLTAVLADESRYGKLLGGAM